MKEMTDVEFEAMVEAARARTEFEDRIEPRAVKAWYDPGRNLVMFEMKNGCVFGFPPLIKPLWGLGQTTPEQLAEVEAIDGGEALHWEESDADVSVPGLLFHLLNVKAWYAKW